jgi:hypothetical protein
MVHTTKIEKKKFSLYIEGEKQQEKEKKCLADKPSQTDV